MTGWIIGYRMYKKGFLPNEGGWLCQCSKFVEVMLFIEEELAKHEREQQEKNARQQS